MKLDFQEKALIDRVRTLKTSQLDSKLELDREEIKIIKRLRQLSREKKGNPSG